MINKDGLLNFMGASNAFDINGENSSAYFVEGAKDKLHIFDMGGSVVSKYINYLNIVDGFNEINVYITHLHDDHIGGLSTFIFYVDKVLGGNLVINTPVQLKDDLFYILKIKGHDMGYIENIYNCLYGGEYINEDIDELDITPIRTKHCSNMNCYGYTIFNPETLDYIYYSGDSETIPEGILHLFKREIIDYIYQDTSILASTPHMSIDSLNELIDEKDRHRVFLYHNEESHLHYMASQYGYQRVFV